MRRRASGALCFVQPSASPYRLWRQASTLGSGARAGRQGRSISARRSRLNARAQFPFNSIQFFSARTAEFGRYEAILALRGLGIVWGGYVHQIVSEQRAKSREQGARSGCTEDTEDTEDCRGEGVTR